jgi:hypothetical protein
MVLDGWFEASSRFRLGSDTPRRHVIAIQLHTLTDFNDRVDFACFRLLHA